MLLKESGQVHTTAQNHYGADLWSRLVIRFPVTEYQAVNTIRSSHKLPTRLFGAHSKSDPDWARISTTWAFYDPRCFMFPCALLGIIMVTEALNHCFLRFCPNNLIDTNGSTLYVERPSLEHCHQVSRSCHGL